MHLSHAARDFRGEPALGMSGVRSANCRIRQYSGAELADSGWQVPQMQSSYFCTLRGSGIAYGGALCPLLPMRAIIGSPDLSTMGTRREAERTAGCGKNVRAVFPADWADFY